MHDAEMGPGLEELSYRCPDHPEVRIGLNQVLRVVLGPRRVVPAFS